MSMITFLRRIEVFDTKLKFCSVNLMIKNMGGSKYHVHYLGFKRSHDRWLSTNNMMKRTPSSRGYYRESRSLSWEMGGGGEC